MFNKHNKNNISIASSISSSNTSDSVISTISSNESLNGVPLNQSITTNYPLKFYQAATDPISSFDIRGTEKAPSLFSLVFDRDRATLLQTGEGGLPLGVLFLPDELDEYEMIMPITLLVENTRVMQHQLKCYSYKAWHLCLSDLDMGIFGFGLSKNDIAINYSNLDGKTFKVGSYSFSKKQPKLGTLTFKPSASMALILDQPMLLSLTISLGFILHCIQSFTFQMIQPIQIDTLHSNSFYSGLIAATFGDGVFDLFMKGQLYPDQIEFSKNLKELLTASGNHSKKPIMGLTKRRSNFFN